MKVVRSIDIAIDKACRFAIVICVGLMLTLALAAIILRFMEKTFLWIDPLIRHLVFFSTFFGGALASGKRRHIGIDFLHKYLESQKKFDKIKWLQRIIDLASFVASAWLAHAAYNFVKMEMEYGVKSFLGIHTGVLTSAIPIGFLIIAMRSLFLFILSFEDKESVNA